MKSPGSQETWQSQGPECGPQCPVYVASLMLVVVLLQGCVSPGIKDVAPASTQQTSISQDGRHRREDRSAEADNEAVQAQGDTPGTLESGFLPGETGRLRGSPRVMGTATSTGQKVSWQGPTVIGGLGGRVWPEEWQLLAGLPSAQE